MQNPTMLLQIIQAERAREIAEQQRVQLARAGRPRGTRFATVRRGLGGMLVRAGMRLLPRESAAATAGARLTPARSGAAPRG